jgi:hypothetical protein
MAAKIMIPTDITNTSFFFLVALAISPVPFKGFRRFSVVSGALDI